MLMHEKTCMIPILDWYMYILKSSAISAGIPHYQKSKKTRTVRGSDYSPAIELSEQKDKLVTATGDTEKYSEKQANKVWLNSVYWFSRY